MYDVTLIAHRVVRSPCMRWRAARRYIPHPACHSPPALKYIDMY